MSQQAKEQLRQNLRASDEAFRSYDDIINNIALQNPTPQDLYNAYTAFIKAFGQQTGQLSAKLLNKGDDMHLFNDIVRSKLGGMVKKLVEKGHDITQPIFNNVSIYTIVRFVDGLDLDLQIWNLVYGIHESYNAIHKLLDNQPVEEYKLSCRLGGRENVIKGVINGKTIARHLADLADQDVSALNIKSIESLKTMYKYCEINIPNNIEEQAFSLLAQSEPVCAIDASYFEQDARVDEDQDVQSIGDDDIGDAFSLFGDIDQVQDPVEATGNTSTDTF